MPKVNFKNVLDTVTSLLSNAATVAREWVFPDKDGTVAMTSDIPDVSGIGTNAEAIASHVANTSNPHSVTAAQTGAYPSGQVDTLLAAKVDEETFATLTFGAPTNWDTDNRQSPLAKVTVTGSFTINMTNVKSGSSGVLKMITNTASAITLTFDTDFTNKKLGTIGQESFTTYTFPAGTAKEYLLSYVADGTTIYWYIDGTPTAVWVDWSASLAPTGFTSISTQLSRYKSDGNELRQWFYVVGVSNANSFTVAVPLAFASAYAAAGVMELIHVTNNSINVVGRAYASGSGTTLTIEVLAGTAWSGTKGCRFMLIAQLN